MPRLFARSVRDRRPLSCHRAAPHILNEIDFAWLILIQSLLKAVKQSRNSVNYGCGLPALEVR